MLLVYFVPINWGKKMKHLSADYTTVIHGGLTDKQTEAIVGKIGAYSANSLLYACLAGAGFISYKTLLISALLAPCAKIAGTYIVYENKEAILEHIQRIIDSMTAT